MPAEIKTPAELVAYFQTQATALGCSFEYGNSERILNRQNSNLEYPVLWLEVPDIRITRSGGLKRQFSTAFLLLSDAPADDYTAQDSALDAMLEKTQTLLQTMMADSDSHPTPFIFDMENCTTQHKPKWSADDDWGWRTEFELTTAECESADCC